MKYLSTSLILLALLVAIVCGVYPISLWCIGQTAFPFQANGSMLQNSAGQVIGSRLIAQPFTEDIYFQPRPSAAAYDASASSSSSLAASNYALRNRIARLIGPVARYKNGQAIGPDLEAWFQADKYDGNPGIVAQWATMHKSLAQAWVTEDAAHQSYVATWATQHPQVVAQFIKDNPSISQPSPSDLAVVFFQSFSKDNPGKFPVKTTPQVMPVSTGAAIQSVFFEMWREAHATADLQDIPGDMVTTSASGLDPHISLANAMYQLDRVAAAWAMRLKRDTKDLSQEITQMITNNSRAAFWSLAGEQRINVLELNIKLLERYGATNVMG